MHIRVDLTSILVILIQANLFAFNSAQASTRDLLIKNDTQKSNQYTTSNVVSEVKPRQPKIDKIIPFPTTNLPPVEQLESKSIELETTNHTETSPNINKEKHIQPQNVPTPRLFKHARPKQRSILAEAKVIIIADDSKDNEFYNKEAGEEHPIYNPILSAHNDPDPNEELNSRLNELNADEPILNVSEEVDLNDTIGKDIVESTSSENITLESTLSNKSSNQSKLSEDTKVDDDEHVEVELVTKSNSTIANNSQVESIPIHIIRELEKEIDEFLDKPDLSTIETSFEVTTIPSPSRSTKPVDNLKLNSVVTNNFSVDVATQTSEEDIKISQEPTESSEVESPSQITIDLPLQQDLKDEEKIKELQESTQQHNIPPVGDQKAEDKEANSEPITTTTTTVASLINTDTLVTDLPQPGYILKQIKIKPQNDLDESKDVDVDESDPSQQDSHEVHHKGGIDLNLESTTTTTTTIKPSPSSETPTRSNTPSRILISTTESSVDLDEDSNVTVVESNLIDQETSYYNDKETLMMLFYTTFVIVIYSLYRMLNYLLFSERLETPVHADIGLDKLNNAIEMKSDKLKKLKAQLGLKPHANIKNESEKVQENYLNLTKKLELQKKLAPKKKAIKKLQRDREDKLKTIISNRYKDGILKNSNLKKRISELEDISMYEKLKAIKRLVDLEDLFDILESVTYEEELNNMRADIFELKVKSKFSREQIESFKHLKMQFKEEYEDYHRESLIIEKEGQIKEETTKKLKEELNKLNSQDSVEDWGKRISDKMDEAYGFYTKYINEYYLVKSYLNENQENMEILNSINT